MFEFTNLSVLHQDMRNVNETRSIFSFEYNRKPFSCIFLVDIIPFRLYLTTYGLTPIVFEFEIQKGYIVYSFIKRYKELVAYLGLRYSPDHKFKPNDFFAVLNRKIPNKLKKKPNYKDVLKLAVKTRDIEEENKIYFCGWYKNPTGKKVRKTNLEKTRSAFGEEKAKICSSNNISSCWTDVERGEAIKMLNDVIVK